MVAVTGDIHTFFAGTAWNTGEETGPARPGFPEFVGGSATSLGIPEATGLPDSTLDFLARGQPAHRLLRLPQARLRGCRGEREPAHLRAEDGRRAGAEPAGDPTLAKFRVAPGTRTPERIA